MLLALGVGGSRSPSSTSYPCVLQGADVSRLRRLIHALTGTDMRNMGGLEERLPITFGTFVVGALAIAGVPLLSGFFSKDEILFRDLRQRATPMLWVIGAADVAADGDLHVPARLPDVPRRARRAPAHRGDDATHGHGASRAMRPWHDGTATAGTCTTRRRRWPSRWSSSPSARSGRLRRRPPCARRREPHRELPRVVLPPRWGRAATPGAPGAVSHAAAPAAEHAVATTGHEAAARMRPQGT